MNTLLLIAYALFVAVVSLRPVSGPSIEPWDKLLHLVTYAIFAVLACRATCGGRWFTTACLGVIVYGALMELAQSCIPGRVMSGYDLLANVLGVVLGATAARRLYGGGVRR